MFRNFWAKVVCLAMLGISAAAVYQYHSAIRIVDREDQLARADSAFVNRVSAIEAQWFAAQGF